MRIDCEDWLWGLIVEHGRLLPNIAARDRQPTFNNGSPMKLPVMSFILGIQMLVLCNWYIMYSQELIHIGRRRIFSSTLTNSRDQTGFDHSYPNIFSLESTFAWLDYMPLTRWPNTRGRVGLRFEGQTETWGMAQDSRVGLRLEGQTETSRVGLRLEGRV